MIFGDFSACVFIDGQDRPEYDVIVSSTPAENRITCWIASEEGKKFGVRWTNITRQPWSIKSVVVVDGFHCRGEAVPPGWVGAKECTCLIDDSVTRDFMFSNIELTDDDSMLDDQNSKEIGQIVLEVNTGYIKEKVVKRHQFNHTRRMEGKVHERSKKACAHRVIFGKEVPLQVPRHVTSKFNLDDRPTTLFVFKYTRLDILQAMGIAPSISKNLIEEEANDDDEIEIIDGPNEPSILPSEDLKPRIQQLEMELQRLRAQLPPSEDRKPSRVKLESGISRRQPATVKVLDLTED
ncbi:uncharacterized protein EDB91DRAFT_226349 [Suillus paluster]|uniref:uncharacterized protein n=1 Tax=Suillus paluster TaxID=48578 RepID=UPI001B87599A|nr:uncharacterized protein EDB91DRAFT_226349 [Suillus paluster]KAG1722026.1 hypothetical protein EDB91DRAFT_226349 [Suillus paluster]